MKRTISLVLALAMALSLAGCAPKQAASQTPQPTPTPTQTDTPLSLTWDLSLLYPDQAAFDAELARYETVCQALTDIADKEVTIESAVEHYVLYSEEQALASRLLTYLLLPVYEDTTNTATQEEYEQLHALWSQAYDTILKIEEKIFAKGEDFLRQLEADLRMKPYLTEFHRSRDQQAHLSTDTQAVQAAEQLRDEAIDRGDTLWNELTFPEITYPDGTKGVADDANYSAVCSKLYSQAFRTEYYNKMMQPFQENRDAFAQALNDYYVGLSQRAALLGYPSVPEAELTETYVPVAIYDAALSAAAQAQPVFERYLDLHKQDLGVETLYNFDINVPLADNPATAYSYEQAQGIVRKALAPLGTEYGETLNRLLVGNTINVYPGEHAAPSPDVLETIGSTPYIQLHYSDDFAGLDTLALMMGGAIHAMYAQAQEAAYSKSPMSLCVITSRFVNQLLLWDYMAENAATEEERQYIAGYQMDLLNHLFFTQAFYARVETRITQAVAAGEPLTADKLDALWLAETKAFFGENYATTDSYASAWMRVINASNSFSTYYYAAGLAAACDIVERLQAGEPGAVENYLAFLAAGDSGTPTEMLRIAGVEAESSACADALARRFNRLMDAYETAK